MIAQCIRQVLVAEACPRVITGQAKGRLVDANDGVVPMVSVPAPASTGRLGRLSQLGRGRCVAI